MVSDRAGRQLDAIADDVILKGLDAENGFLVGRIERDECLRSKFGMEKGLCEKSIFLSSSFHSYIGKSTIQQNSKTSVFDRPSSLPMLSRAAPASFAAFVFLVAGEEHRVAGLDARLSPRSPPAPRAGMNLAIGPLPVSAPPSPSKIT